MLVDTSLIGECDCEDTTWMIEDSIAVVAVSCELSDWEVIEREVWYSNNRFGGQAVSEIALTSCRLGRRNLEKVGHIMLKK